MKYICPRCKESGIGGLAKRWSDRATPAQCTACGGLSHVLASTSSGIWVGSIAIFMVSLIGGLGLLALAVFSNPDRSAGRIEGPGRGQSQFEASQRASLEAAAALTTTAAAPAKSVLFGDLHVHSTFSIDAFAFALPIFGGEGAHPPADAQVQTTHCTALRPRRRLSC